MISVHNISRDDASRLIEYYFTDIYSILDSNNRSLTWRERDKFIRLADINELPSRDICDMIFELTYYGC